MSVIAVIFASMIWMNGKFTEIDSRFHSMDLKFACLEREMDARFSSLEKEVAIIKTVLIMKNILPSELAQQEPKPKLE